MARLKHHSHVPAHHFNHLVHMIIGIIAISFLLPTSVRAIPPTTSPGVSVRLVDANTTSKYMYGGLEVSFNGDGVWMAVCDYYFTQPEGNVVCTMLGFKRAEVVIGRAHPGSSRTPYPNHWTCDGGELSLDECILSTDFGVCDNKTKTASLLCYNDPMDVIQMRLSHGQTTTNSLSGRLEVKLPFLEWGTVCDDLTNAAMAKAACNYLGYEYGEEDWYHWLYEDYYYNYYDHWHYYYGDYDYYYDYEHYWDYWYDWDKESERQTADLRVVMDEVNCEPGQSFFDCAHDPWGRHDCTAGYEDIWLYCTNKTVRLLSAVQVDHHVGSVEMYVENEGWYEVCDTNWNDQDAKVACKELGYVDGRSMCCNSLGAKAFGSVTFVGSISDVACTGNETTLASCPRKESTYCRYDNDALQLAATICYNETVDKIDMNLAVHLIPNPHGSQDAGLVQLTYMGVKGIVCDEKATFEDEESTVACKMLGKGYIGGVRLNNFTHGGSIHHSWLRDVDCTGNETSIDECRKSAWGAPAEFHCQAPVHVICYKEDLKLTLLKEEGETKDQGIIQIVKDGVMGSICADKWTDVDAHSACLTMGFNGGQVWKLPQTSTMSYSKTFMLSSVVCQSTKGFFMCENHGWGVANPACKEDAVPAGGKCFNNLKLEPRVGGTGVVKVYKNDQWVTICSNGFDLTAAQVTCQQLGYKNGTLLSTGSFGYIEESPFRSAVKCNGSETSLLQCTFDESIENCNYYSDYAAVSCYNQLSETPDGTLSLEDAYVNLSVASGVLKIQKNNTDLYFCANFISKTELDVFCRDYGKRKGASYSGGISFQDKEIPGGPFYPRHLSCYGAETTIEDCPAAGQFDCYVKRAAGVICYTTEEPKFRIKSDGRSVHSGQLVLSNNAESGAICADTWSDDDADVACLSLSESYRGGKAMKMPKNGYPWLLSSFDCFGQENSLFECPSSPWRRVNETCDDNAMAAGVVCYTSVSLTKGNLTIDYFSGVLEVKRYSTDSEVCFDDKFTQQYAENVCTELGFDYAAFLKPSRLADEYYTTKNIQCEGTEKSISKCAHRIGYCDEKYGAVRILCYKNQINALNRWTIQNESHGILMTNSLNSFVGYSCRSKWTDKDADTVCKAKKFKGGKALGASKAKPMKTSSKDIVWFGSLSCISDAAGQFCSFKDDADRSCYRKKEERAAAVLCYKNDEGIKIRLMDHDKKAKFAGRVEINYGGVWGTVCNKNGGRLQARTLCKEIGFTDGTILSAANSKRFGVGSGPIYLKDVACSMDDEYFIGCPSDEGWNSTSNCTHNDDLEVICYSDVRVFPDAEKSYGTIGQMINGAYSLICKDGFTDVEAGVACRYLGYTSGKAVCCSTDHSTAYRIGINKVQCTGTESSLSNCTYETSGSFNCESEIPAAVACSLGTQGDEYTLRAADGYSGILTINYLEADGNVCPEHFDHPDAKVVCNEMGFYGGFAVEADSYDEKPILWPFNADCVGSESRLSACPRLDIMSTEGGPCPVAQVAAVRCLRTSNGPTGAVRIEGGRETNEGRLEIQIDGVWGSVVPLRYRVMDDKVAHVVCSQLGFVGGQSLPPGSFGKGADRVWFTEIVCAGTEKNILDCQLKNITSRATPFQVFAYDASIQCFSGVKLVHSPDTLPNSGQIAVKNMTEDTWNYVCDTGISDVEATVACRGLGYRYGKRQCCNPAGMNTESVVITSIKCGGNEQDLLKCTISREGVCDTKVAAYIHCSNTEFSSPGLTIEPMFDFAGMPEAKAYGITGSICATGLGNEEAVVMCRQLGFVTGMVLKPKKQRPGDLILVSSLNCTGREQRVSDCGHHSLEFEAGCPERKAAQILCKTTHDPVKFRIETSGGIYADRAEIVIDGAPYFVSIHLINTHAATVFCSSMTDGDKYSYGEIISKQVPGGLDGRVLMTSVHCGRDDNTFLECDAVYLPKYQRVMASDVAYIKCHSGVELSSGQFPNSGILNMYNKKADYHGSVCSSGFGQKETDVACRMLNYDFGIPHCCSSFGFNHHQTMFKYIKCTGSETSLFQCDLQAAQTNDEYFCSDQDYVELSCFNGTRANDFKVAIWGDDSSSVGRVKVDYMNIPGSICSDDWDDKDATVVCKELGYAAGIAYFHYKPLFMLSSSSGPYWLSKVGCTGNETRLVDCPSVKYGDVKTCDHGHNAGVLCTTENEIAFRIAGTDQAHFGRVEVKLNGVWGTICSRYWDQKEADVMCRQMGYNSGVVYNTKELTIGTGPVYEIGPRCTGKEKRLNDCPHEGWFSDLTGSCANHRRDAGVFCYSSVRLGTGSGQSYNHGPVLLFEDDKWYRVCDDGFNDLTARKVCQELGFFTGKKICCSAYEGESTSEVRRIHPNTTLSCVNDDQTVQQCRLNNGECKSGYYASVVCLAQSDDYSDTDYTVTIDEDFQLAGKLEVTHYGIQGRICSSNWTDVDASVVCKERGMMGGMAYYHSFKEDYVDLADIGPFWMSNVSCVGNETKFSDCKFNTRLDLGNCSSEHTAAVICYNENAIQYRLSGTDSKPNSGRVEMSIDNRWGTVCDELWDDRDARVVCRERGYNDGQIEKNSQFGGGSGPVWLRNVQCDGSEAALHVCPHTGFQDEEGSNNLISFFVNPCSTHKKDAAVFCFDAAKLNQPLGHPSGGLYFYNEGQWEPICADSFSRQDAQVACKDLLQGYVDGLPIDGGRFGDVAGNITVNSLSCTGSEDSLMKCSKSEAGSCPSGNYASVACFKTPLTDDDFKFQVRLASDSIRTSDDHGILEVRQKGVWGRVCMHGFTDKEATVACKSLGFMGGNVYLHLFRNLMPIIWSKTSCRGTENSLENCEISTDVDNDNCAFSDQEAGLLCYKKSGVEYRLSKQSSGRVEIGIEGKFGTVCQINWSKVNSRVLCRQLGYVDGIPMYDVDRTLDPLPTLMSFFLCNGEESNLLTCLNSGFDQGANSVVCGGEAYTACYKEEAKVTKIRLQGGTTTAEGRVEVFVEPTNEWGTICDDGWTNVNAKVVCQQLGYDSGVALDSEKDVEPGTGNIFLDNVECNGTESELSSCKHNGINFHNCDHYEDAGVRCYYAVPPPATTSTTTKSEPTTASSSTTTSPKTTTTTVATKVPTSSTKLTTASVKPITTKPRSSTTAKTTSTSTTQSTTKSTTTSTTTATTSSTTTDMGGLPNKQRSSGDDDDDDKVVIAASVSVVILAIIGILVVIFVIYRYRIKPKSTFNHERFHNESVEQSNDGSVAISNRLYGLDNPDGGVGGGDPMSNYMADGSEIHLDRAGYASFSKGSPPPVTNGETPPDGFNNPLYAAKNSGEVSPDDIIAGVNNANHTVDDNQYESMT